MDISVSPKDLSRVKSLAADVTAVGLFRVWHVHSPFVQPQAFLKQQYIFSI